MEDTKTTKKARKSNGKRQTGADDAFELLRAPEMAAKLSKVVQAFDDLNDAEAGVVFRAIRRQYEGRG